MNARSIAKSALLLGLFAAVGTALLAFVFDLTEERIIEQQRRAVLRAVNQVIPSELYDNDPFVDQIVLTDVPELGGNGPFRVFRGRSEGQPVAVAIEAIAPDGYSGDIAMMIGILTNGEISGVRVTSHRETPGLGDRIDRNKSDWISSFDGLSLANTNDSEWAVKRDGGQFDQFTGATITPRAVVQAVHRALVWVNDNQDRLYLTDANTQP
ncbi:MAG: electron transport complex subunit G [Lysobacteraceae bacterium]|nr:MAG: electron transport complex subunit G [Xanthomonadaceae bacterium]